MATAGMSTAELETLFLQKLTEKYELTERSIKKAFSRFDADGNGLLNLNELVSGFESFLNGVSRKQVQELVFSYDVNGDGVISFEEFFRFLTNRQGGRVVEASRGVVVVEVEATAV
jgi:Ca2+-binding EF-hand superfamily protein